MAFRRSAARNIATTRSWFLSARKRAPAKNHNVRTCWTSSAWVRTRSAGNKQQQAGSPRQSRISSRSWGAAEALVTRDMPRDQKVDIHFSQIRLYIGQAGIGPPDNGMDNSPRVTNRPRPRARARRLPGRRPPCAMRLGANGSARFCWRCASPGAEARTGQNRPGRSRAALGPYAVPIPSRKTALKSVSPLAMARPVHCDSSWFPRR